jgi:hypothetical protein
LKLKLVAANARKLSPLFIGPFTVNKRVNAVAYKSGLPESMKEGSRRVTCFSVEALYEEWFISASGANIDER